MENVEKLKEKIEVKSKQINEIEAEIEQLKNQREELNNELSELTVEKQTIEVLQSIYNMNPENAKRVILRDYTRTTPIIDDFYYSDKKFLVFEDAFRSFDFPQKISVVVTKNNTKVNYEDSGLTMTVLKQSVNRLLSEKAYEYTHPKTKMHALVKEIVDVSKQITNEIGLIPFNNPCLLRGQKYNDQKDFGKEQWGDYVVKNKPYGYATEFLIIGIELT